MHPTTCSWVRYPEEKTLFVEHITLKLGSVMRWRDTIVLLLFGWGSASSPWWCGFGDFNASSFYLLWGLLAVPRISPEPRFWDEKKNSFEKFGKSSSNFRINYLGLLTWIQVHFSVFRLSKWLFKYQPLL